MGILMKTPLITLLALVVSCSYGQNEKKEHVEPIEELQIKADSYARLYDSIADESGFFDDNDCDALLFNALYGFGVDIPSIEAFFDSESGKWFRTPSKQCYEEGRSGSTISRDMLIGVMWWAWKHDRIDLLERLRRYGQEHDWIMGQGSIDRTYFTPNFQMTLYVLLNRDYKGPPELWVDPIKDHQRHVVALNIVLRGEKQGWINHEMLALLELFYSENPSNALFSYGVGRFRDGKQAETINILLNPVWFPSDRLPSASDRCGRWLWERTDSHENWSPCQGDKIHSGGDLIFIAELLKRSQGEQLDTRSD